MNNEHAMSGIKVYLLHGIFLQMSPIGWWKSSAHPSDSAPLHPCDPSLQFSSQTSHPIYRHCIVMMCPAGPAGQVTRSSVWILQSRHGDVTLCVAKEQRSSVSAAGRMSCSRYTEQQLTLINK